MTQPTASRATPRKPILYLAALMLVLLPLAVWLNLRRQHGNRTSEHIERGITALKAQQLDLAEKEWHEALKTDPTRTEPYLLLAELYASNGSPEAAVPLLERLTKLAPGTPHLYSRLAECYSLTEQPAQALAAAQKAVTQDPSDPRAHALLGIQMGNRMDARGAVAELSKATLLAPGDDKIAISLAQAQLDAGDFPGAERTARQVIARNDRYPTAYYVLGWSFSRRPPTPDNLQQAADAFRAMTRLAPGAADAYAELGRLSLLKSDPQSARAALAKAWELGLRDEATAFNLAAAYRKTGDARRAEEMNREFKRISDYQTRSEALKKTLSVSPNKVDVALQLAELEIDARHYNEAVPIIQGLLKMRGRDLRTLRAAERLFAGMGNSQAAAIYHQRVAALNGPQTGRQN